MKILLSQTCKCKTYSSTEAANKNFYIYNNAQTVCEICYHDSDGNGHADVEATLLGVLTDRTNNACSPANGYFKEQLRKDKLHLNTRISFPLN